MARGSANCSTRNAKRCAARSLSSCLGEAGGSNEKEHSGYEAELLSHLLLLMEDPQSRKTELFTCC